MPCPAETTKAITALAQAPRLQEAVGGLGPESVEAGSVGIALEGRRVVGLMPLAPAFDVRSPRAILDTLAFLVGGVNRSCESKHFT